MLTPRITQQHAHVSKSVNQYFTDVIFVIYYSLMHICPFFIYCSVFSCPACYRHFLLHLYTDIIKDVIYFVLHIVLYYNDIVLLSFIFHTQLCVQNTVIRLHLHLNKMDQSQKYYGTVYILILFPRLINTVHYGSKE